MRLFHWTLVLLFAGAWLTGDEFDRVHEVLGYAIVALLLVRIVWGFVGSEHARFRDFVQAPSTVPAYARDTLAGKARRYSGHNPLGGVMVLLLIAGHVAGVLFSSVAHGENLVRGMLTGMKPAA